MSYCRIAGRRRRWWQGRLRPQTLAKRKRCFPSVPDRSSKRGSFRPSLPAPWSSGATSRAALLVPALCASLRSLATLASNGRSPAAHGVLGQAKHFNPFASLLAGPVTRVAGDAGRYVRAIDYR
jgi:hypothetical protein